MSSTARGGQRSPADFYETVAWGTYHLVNALVENCTSLLREPGDKKVVRILEPCAGKGAIVRAGYAMLEYQLPELAQVWTALELESHGEDLRSIILGSETQKADHQYSCLTKTDFFPWAMRVRVSAEQKAREQNPAWPFDVVMMNPPFRLAKEFIETCLGLAPVVRALLRLNWLGGDDRNEFMRASKPSIFVIPNRIPFIREKPEVIAKDAPEFKIGATDSIEYAWFIWGLKIGNYDPMIQVLKSVPKELRPISDKFVLEPSPEAWMKFVGRNK